MSVNQDNNLMLKKKDRFLEIPAEHGFLDEKLRVLKGSKSSYIDKISCNINKISKYLHAKSVETDKSIQVLKN